MKTSVASAEAQQQAKTYVESVCDHEVRKVFTPGKAYTYKKKQSVLALSVKCEACISEPSVGVEYLSVWCNVIVTFMDLESATMNQTPFRLSYPITVFVQDRPNPDSPLEFELAHSPYDRSRPTQFKDLQRKVGKIFRCP